MQRPLARLTPREERVAGLLRRAFPADVMLVLAAVVLGAAARGLVAAYCHAAPVNGPLEGTAGAAYCSSVSGAWSWGAFVISAVVIVGLVRLLWGGRRFARAAGLATVMLALIANTIIVYSLQDLGP